MKKRLFLFSCFAVVFAFLLLNTLSAVTEENAAKETELPPIISDLLSGKNTDLQSALSNLEETDFPLALTACEILQHKALHQDIKTSPKAVEVFKGSLQKRLETSQAVSLKQTPTCIQKIPAREIIIEGKHLTVPEHYLAPVKLAITGFSPTGEAGTLLPDIQVTFTGGKAPIEAKFVLDGKEVPPKLMKNSFLYRPKLSTEFLLKFGKHKVEAVFTDAASSVASASWSFTVGLESTTMPQMPSDAVLVGSFSTSVGVLLPGATGKDEIGISIFESPDGRRFFEYQCSDPTQKNGLVLKTRSLFGLFSFINKGKHRDSINILPKVGCVFSDEPTRLSYVYSGSGNVIKTAWKAQEPEGSETGSFETPTISWQVKKWSEIELTLTVEYHPPEGSPYTASYGTRKTLTAMEFSSSNWYGRYYELVDTLTGSEKLDGSRDIRNIYTYERKPLVEGESFSFPDGSKGRITVVRSRWKIVSGTAEAEVENPTAVKTNLMFSKFGSVELIHDIAISYDWEDEHYEKIWQPNESILYGRFPYKASVEFKQLPPGIILNTIRNFIFKTIDLEINGDKRHITSQPGQFITLDPPIILAKSELFPDSKPAKINAMIPVIIRKTAQSYEQLPYPTNFQIPLNYDKSVNLINGEISCRAYFLYGDTGKLKKKTDWDEFFDVARPLTDWFSIKGYSAPAELIDIAIDPQNPEINEDEKVDFSATIVPKPGLGSGSITTAGGSLNLLDGYESQQIDSFEWESKLLPNVPAKREDNRLKFLFEPKQGSGSYEIKSKTLISVKDKVTNSTAQVSGIATTAVTVKAGLSILYPGDGYVIPENQKFVLKTAPDQYPASSLEWKIDNQKIGTGFEVPVLGLVPGDHAVSLEVKNNSLPPVQAKIRIVEWRFSLSPESQVFLWQERPFETEILGHSSIDGQGVSSDLKPLNIGKALIEPQPMTLFWKSEPENKIKCGNPEKFKAVCSFGAAGRFEAVGSHSIFITQPDGKKEICFSNEASSLLGSIIAKADYSFSFEPVRALVGMTREFSIGSVTINIGDQKPIVITEFPQVFSEPVAVVNPLLTNRPGIRAIKYDHFAGFSEENGKKRSGSRESLAVTFKDETPLRIFWTPNLFFDNGQSFLLAETVRKIKPQNLSELIKTKIVPIPSDKPIFVWDTVKFRFFFGPHEADMEHQDEISLFDGDYKIKLDEKNLEWFSNGQSLKKLGPNISHSFDIARVHTISASPTFQIQPQEVSVYGEEKRIFPVPLPLKILGKLRIQNAKTGACLDEFFLSYRDPTPFKAIVQDAVGSSEIAVTWQLEDIGLWKIDTEISRKGILKEVFGIDDENFHIGILPGSSSKDIGKSETLFQPFFSGKIRLVAETADQSAAATLNLSQPVVYCHYKMVEGLATTTANPLIDVWGDKAFQLWSGEGENDDLIRVFDRNSDVEVIKNKYFGEALASGTDPEIASSSEPLVYEKSGPLTFLNPLTWDEKAGKHFGIPSRYSIVPRQAKDLLQENRVASSVNVYFVKQPYWFSYEKGLEKTNGVGISKDDYVHEKLPVERIDDVKEAGIILKLIGDNPNSLAHELGHLLIQNGNEHDVPPGSLMQGDGMGDGISPKELWYALDYQREKTFILEEDFK